jgi:hypothetical protein
VDARSKSTQFILLCFKINDLQESYEFFKDTDESVDRYWLAYQQYVRGSFQNVWKRRSDNATMAQYMTTNVFELFENVTSGLLVVGYEHL